MLDYSDKSTIFAPATHPGKAGLAVIRISGKNSLKALYKISKLDVIKPRHATYAKLYYPDTDDVIDHALILYFQAPMSFTGEDIIELHTHGSVAIINIMMDILLGLYDLRVALPGEFARRAFINGKMDLTRSEGLADLIDAETSLQQKQAIRQMSGELQMLYESWRGKIIKTLAYLEAFLDFPDEELPEDLINEIDDITNSLSGEIRSHLSDNKRGEKMRSGLYVSIIGKTNVGKSSLMNFLAKRDVAIISNIAGTTRDVIEVHLDINGYPITIADTAGIRDSDDEIESIGIDKAIKKISDSDFNIVMFDIEEIAECRNLLDLVDSKNNLYVINKLDKRNINNIKFPFEYCGISIKTGEGLPELLEKLEEKAKSIMVPSATPVITRARYRVHLQKCLDYLATFSLKKDLELAAEDLRLAASEIAEITGVIDIDVILDEIFGNFCIGK